MTAADNWASRVRRGYFPNGALKVDSASYRSPTGGSYSHLAVITSHYDLSGRRDTLTLPNDQKIAYGFSTVDGALSTIVDPFATQYRYVYDVAGRVDSVVIGANAIREKRWYDADHRQYARERTSSAYSSSENLTFDAQGRVFRAVSGTNANGAHADSTLFTYSGLGAVLARERFMLGSTNWETEEFRVDGLGNVLRGRVASRDFAPSQPQLATFGKRGELTSRWAIDDPVYTQKFDSLVQEFDLDGNLVMSHHLVRDQGGNAITDNPTRNYYGGDGKLRAVHRHNQGRGAWEEYRYDALGRRVMVIARLGGETEGCDLSGLTYCNPVCTASATGDCEQKTTWQVWDGDQLIREERRPYPDGAISSERYGIVHYVHGLELDHPLAVLQDGARILNPTWRGQFEASVTASGASADCALPTGGWCDNIPWPDGHGVYARKPPFEQTGGTNPFTWAGSLLLDGQDGTGNMYRRNRYYDPVSGRFTQEDPIGLAGGTNLYGFANGDPITYSDPFGLCPDPKNPKCTAGTKTFSITAGAFFGVGKGQISKEGFGLNVNAGLAVDDRGSMMLYGTYGPSISGGRGAGVQFGAQHGNLNELVSATGQGGGYTLAGAAGKYSGSIMLDDNGRFDGAAVGAGAGTGASLNLTSAGRGLVTSLGDIRNGVASGLSGLSAGWEDFKRNAYQRMAGAPK